MRVHLVVDSNDLTDYIVDGSYDVNTEDAYESWQDGNMVEHRVIVGKKVVGSFSILCSDKTITLSNFLTHWNNAVVNGVVTIGLYVPNLNSFEALNCYYEITNAEHIKRVDDSFIDVMKVTVKER